MQKDDDKRFDYHLNRLINVLVDHARAKHKRAHTLPVNPKHARGAKRFDPCDCVIAHAAQDLPEVYAAVIMRRYAYLLEKDDKGRVKVFRYNSPKEARQLTLNFDKGEATQRTMIHFRPLSYGRTLEYQRAYKRRWARGATGKRSGRPDFNKWSFTRRHNMPQADQR